MDVISYLRLITEIDESADCSAEYPLLDLLSESLSELGLNPEVVSVGGNISFGSHFSRAVK